MHPCHLIFSFWYVCCELKENLKENLFQNWMEQPWPLWGPIGGICCWIRKDSGLSNSEEHEYEWVVDIRIVAENWPASPEVFAIWRQPTEAGHTEETRRFVNILNSSIPWHTTFRPCCWLPVHCPPAAQVCLGRHRGHHLQLRQVEAGLQPCEGGPGLSRHRAICS